MQIRTAIDGGTLEFVPAGVALRTSKASVLELAEQIISTSEAALRLDIDARCVAGALNGRSGITRRLFGWSRSDFEAWQSRASDQLLVQPPNLLLHLAHPGNKQLRRQEQRRCRHSRSSSGHCTASRETP